MLNNAALYQWLQNSDPSLSWQVERDLLEIPESTWQTTRAEVARSGYGHRLLQLQDADGQWAGGAYRPRREEPRALQAPSDSDGQPYIATTWSLNALREWGLDPAHLGDTGARLAQNCRWEFDDLPYWQGEVDCCINSFTLANGAWLNQDISSLAQWFLDRQLSDGGWNCEWTEGATRSSFHSTLNALIGLRYYEEVVGRNPEITEARRSGGDYLLNRNLMNGLRSGTEVGAWVTQSSYPFRWRYSTIRALDYLRSASLFDNKPQDPRASDAVARLLADRTDRGTWLQQKKELGQIWFEVDAAVGEESKWLTFYSLRILNWWNG